MKAWVFSGEDGLQLKSEIVAHLENGVESAKDNAVGEGARGVAGEVPKPRDRGRNMPVELTDELQPHEDDALLEEASMSTTYPHC